jgi:hypothetical protein
VINVVRWQYSPAVVDSIFIFTISTCIQYFSLILVTPSSEIPNILQTLWFMSLCCDAIPTEIQSHSVLGTDVIKAITAAAQSACVQVSSRGLFFGRFFLMCGVLVFCQSFADARCSTG